MRKFILNILLIFVLPLSGVVAIYCYIDPFRVIKPFSVHYFLEKPIYTTNIEYYSINLFDQNYPTQQYNSFIIGSSRTCAFNTYQWKYYLASDSRPFILTSWRENIVGIKQKIEYLDAKGVNIKNCIILLDCGSQYSFSVSNGQAPLTNHFYRLTNQNYIRYQFDFFGAVMSPPRKFVDIIKQRNEKRFLIDRDTITNDSHVYKDSLDLYQKMMSHNIGDFPVYNDSILPRLLTISQIECLHYIRKQFEKHDTDFKIIICPNYFKWHINPDDLYDIINIFEDENVFDYSNSDRFVEKKYYSDEEHFDSFVAWQIIKDLYTRE